MKSEQREETFSLFTAYTPPVASPPCGKCNSPEAVTEPHANSGLLGALAIKRYAALKVVSVTPGWDNATPELRQLSRFEDQFLTEDPRLKHKWSAATWAAIESNRTVTGMSAEQVKMSWGEPQQTSRTATGEVWTYSNSNLSFNKNGVPVNWQKSLVPK